jgi:hypothetical protein
MVFTRALIFHMSIPCGKTFLSVFFFFYVVTLILEYGLLFRSINLLHNCKMSSTIALIFLMIMTPPPLFFFYFNIGMAINGISLSLRHLCFTSTSCFMKEIIMKVVYIMRYKNMRGV